jgi:hypothetical protein
MPPFGQKQAQQLDMQQKINVLQQDYYVMAQ